MRYLLMSDTHGELQRALYVLRKHKDVDACFHLGDVGFDEQYLPVMRIACGNHDRNKYPIEIPLTLSDIPTLLVHGHQFEYELVERMQQDTSVWKNWDSCMDILYETISKQALKKGYGMVLFGHTHTAHFEKRNGVWLCNPGSLCFSHDDKPPSYAILTIDQMQVTCTFHYIEDDDI